MTYIVNTYIIDIYTFLSLLPLCMVLKSILKQFQESSHININTTDSLGRSALMIAIDNENLEIVELLVDHCDNTYDALLHAISVEFVEAVEVLLDCDNLEPRSVFFETLMLNPHY